jgi:hypothetical protein
MGIEKREGEMGKIEEREGRGKGEWRGRGEGGDAQGIRGLWEGRWVERRAENLGGFMFRILRMGG